MLCVCAHSCTQPCPDTVLLVALHCARAMEHMHSRKVSHNDIKLQSVLYLLTAGAGEVMVR